MNFTTAEIEAKQRELADLRAQLDAALKERAALIGHIESAEQASVRFTEAGTLVVESDDDHDLAFVKAERDEALAWGERLKEAAGNVPICNEEFSHECFCALPKGHPFEHSITSPLVAALSTPPPTSLKELTERVRKEALEPQWVVNSLAELGVRIGERFFFLYKGENIEYADDPTNEDGTPMMWRPVFKREFGECCHPVNYADPTLIGAVSLNDSDDWKPLPRSSDKKEPR